MVDMGRFKTHFETSFNGETGFSTVACNAAHGQAGGYTTNVGEVTCGHCKRSRAYKAALAEARRMVDKLEKARSDAYLAAKNFREIGMNVDAEAAEEFARYAEREIAKLEMFTVERSNGHITFNSGWEWFEVRGEVYKAPQGAPLADYINGTRHGRWECSRAHFERFKSVLLGVR
jgi:hypothetical protein